MIVKSKDSLVFSFALIAKSRIAGGQTAF
jgi:hypothetical protein